jgi:2,3-bisphosphoglycerate-independent phosphoglycerate mutase
VTDGQRRGKVLFVFADGVGLAPPGPDNPLSVVPMPHLRGLLGGPLVRDALGPDRDPRTLRCESSSLTFCALDACLGVPGLPQSATGQTALFTGINAPALVGGHITAYPTARLREVIAEHSLLKRARESGATVVFANAHSQRFWDLIGEGKRSLAASTLTALAAGADIPDLQELLAGDAVLWDLTHEVAAGYLGYELPTVSASEAGSRLARMTDRYDLVMFETFLTDLAGHRRIEPEWVLSRLDAFIGGILSHRRPDTTLVLSSDHGNIEDTSTRSHTRNPVPLVAVGPAAGRFSDAQTILDVAPGILAALGDVGPQNATVGAPAAEPRSERHRLAFAGEAW